MLRVFFLTVAFSLDTWPEGACGKKIFKGGRGGGSVEGGKISLPIEASLRLLYFLLISIRWLLFFFLSV